MICIDEATYTVCMHLLREAQRVPPLFACPVSQTYRQTETKLRIAMMRSIAEEITQLTDGEAA